MSDRAEKLMELSVAAKRYAEAIEASVRASATRAALGPHATRARITSANARWARCAEDRDRKEDRFKRALEAFDSDDHSEDILDMVSTTCKDVLQVADETASKKSGMPGLYGPIWEFNEQRIGEFARRLASAQQAGNRPATGTVADYPDEDLLRRAVCNLAPRARRQPAWARIGDVFALGSTYSKQLCRRFGIDPDTGKTTQRTGSRGEVGDA